MAKVNLHELLSIKYPPGECVLMCEVSDTTGGRNQSCDYMVLNLWGSRGHSLIGFEKKISRSDWLRELKQPEKQERIFKYCDYFYLLTTAEEGIAKMEEIPHNWGWMCVKGSRLFIKKPAPALTAQPLSRQFLCSMIRRAADKTGYVPKSEIKQEIDNKVEERVQDVKRQLEWAENETKNLRQVISDFERAAGINIQGRFEGDPEEIGKAVRLVMQGNSLLQGVRGELEWFHRHVNSISKQCDVALKGIEQLEEKEPLLTVNNNSGDRHAGI